jgi:hypothetical protein
VYPKRRRLASFSSLDAYIYLTFFFVFQADAHVKAGVVNHVVALLTSGTSAVSALSNYFLCRDAGGAGGTEAQAASGEFPKKENFLLAREP